MVGDLFRCVEKAEQAVSDKFINSSGMLAQPAREDLEIFGQVMNKNIGGDLLAMCRESLDIGKKMVSRRISRPIEASAGEEPAHDIIRDKLDERAQPRLHPIGRIAQLIDLLHNRMGHFLRDEVELADFGQIVAESAQRFTDPVG